MKLSNEYLATLLDNISEAIVVTDTAYHIVYFNRVAEHVFGYSVEETLGRPLDLLLPERFVESHRQHCREFMAASQTIGMMKNRPGLAARRKDGAEFPVKIGLSKVAQGGEEFCATIVVDITELARAEDALRQSDEKFHALIEHGSEVITLVDAQGLVFFASPAAERMLGYSNQEILGQAVLTWVHPGEREHVRELLVRLMSEPGSMQTAECRVQHQDGTWRWIEAIGTNLLEIPAVHAIVINYRDITEHKQAADALRESEEKFRLIAERITEVFYLVDIRNDKTLYVSPGFEQVWGMSRSEVEKSPQNFMKAIHPDDLERVKEGLQVMQSGLPFDLEYRIIRPDGVMRWIWDRGYPVHSADGTVNRYVGVAQDITERVRTEAVRQQAEDEIKKLNQDLERRARELAALNRAGQAMTSTLDLDLVSGLVMKEGRDLMDAEAASVLLQEGDELVFVAAAGLGSDTLVGMRLPVTAGIAGWVMQTGKAVLVGEAHSDPHFDDRVDAATGMTTRSLLAVPLIVKGVPRGVIEAVNKTGQAFDKHDLELLEGIARPAAIAIENAQLYAHLEKSLQQEKKTRAQLIQAGKLSAMGRMVASMAHEFNNPLQTIKNCLFLVQEGVAPAVEQRRFLNMAASEVERLSRLVTQLRAVYRPAAGDQMQAVELYKIVEQVRSLVAPHLSKNRVWWECAEPPHPLTVSGIADQLKQVFLNLSLNACEAMQAEGGTLTVSLTTTADGRQAGVTFRDTGPGIDPQALPDLFEPFFTTKETGMGLGLAICYDIVQKHSGRIEVESQPGQGAAFTVWLPLASP